MKLILRSIEKRLRKEGYVNIINAPELRKFAWQLNNTVVTILLNHGMTEMHISKSL